jgi:peptidyl-prolyl cis-trans isomerase SurA
MVKSMKILFVTFLSLSTLILSSRAEAETSGSRILAEVNKDLITHSDLEERIRLILLTGGMAGKDKKTIDSLRPEVLKSLIQEHLQIQAAKQNNIKIEEAEIDKALKGMAQENGMTIDQMIAMLKSHQISKECMASRLRSQMAWIKYIQFKYGPLVKITEQEIDQELAKLEHHKNKRQYALSEILLLISNPTQERQVLMQAKQIVADIRKGGNFTTLAQQLSKDPSSAKGGDLGWLSEEQVDPAVVPVIQNLAPGQVSEPIRTSSGYKIIKLRSRRLSGETDPNEADVTICQVVFPITPDSPQEMIHALAPQVEETLKISGCARLKASAEKLGASVEVSPKMKLGDLPDQLRQLISKANIGKCTQPIMTPNGLIVTMLCSREEAKVTLPSRDDVYSSLEHDKLSKYAGRELQKLLSAAYLNIKDESLKNVVR